MTTSPPPRIPERTVQEARALYAAFAQARTVLIAGEPEPDGDALGAELALRHVVEHAHAGRAAGDGGRVVVANEEGVPRPYAFMRGGERLVTMQGLIEPDGGFDLAVVVDGGVERIGRLAEVFKRARRTALVDHHRFGSQSAYDLRLFDADAASTTELVWTFFADPDLGVPLAIEAAEALYLGLIFDTGSFQYPLTRPLTHEIAARLMDHGIDFAGIHERALLTLPFEEILEQSRVLARAQRSPCGRVAFACVDHAELHAAHGDLAKVVQTLTFAQGVELAFVLFEDEPGKHRVSLRSRGKVDVGRLARVLDAGGGGHGRAAGCELDGDGAAIRDRIVAAALERLDAPA